MNIGLPALGAAFAAFCLWLTVRIINRRERWAKRTAAALLFVVLVAYPLSFGPRCWEVGRSQDVYSEMILYRPILWLWSCSPGPIQSAIGWYASLACDADLELVVARSPDGPPLVIKVAR
jgi:hypothetical protein